MKKVFKGYTFSGWESGFYWNKDSLKIPNINRNACPPLLTEVQITIEVIDKNEK